MGYSPGEQTGPQAHASTLAPPGGLLGFEFMFSPHLYLIHQSSPSLTIGRQGQKSIWEEFVLHTHAVVCTKPYLPPTPK